MPTSAPTLLGLLALLAALLPAPARAGLDWDRTEGLADTLGKNGVSSNYRFDLAPRTWDFIRDLRSGSAVFMMPSGPRDG